MILYYGPPKIPKTYRMQTQTICRQNNTEPYVTDWCLSRDAPSNALSPPENYRSPTRLVKERPPGPITIRG